MSNVTPLPVNTNPIANEPVLTAATITAVVGAVVTVLTVVGVHIPDALRDALVGLAVVVVPLVAGVIARHHTRAKVTVLSAVEDGKAVAGEASSLQTGTPVDLPAAA